MSKLFIFVIRLSKTDILCYIIIKHSQKNVLNLFECYNFWELEQANLKVYDVVRTVLID